MSDPDVPEPAGVGGIVPHFYYDLLGRIVPGVYLLVAGHWLVQLKGKPPALGNSLSVTAIVITALTAYAISFLLGPCSYWVFDRWWHRWWRFDEKDLDEINDVLDKNGIPRPVGTKGKLHRSILKQSELCSYTLWLRAPQLAIIFSRWDAEAFAARQIGMVTIILFGVTAWMIRKGNPPDHAWGVLVLFLLIAVFSAVQFCYSRRKATFARFRMLASTTLEEARSATAQR